MPLPDLILNSAFQEDFDAADAPCFGLGLARIGGERLAIMALKPARAIPPEVLVEGMAVGHRIVGTGHTVLCQFGFRFPGFALFTTLINPANPVMRQILATIAETGNYLFATIGDARKVTALQPGPGSLNLQSFRANLPVMLNTTTTDLDYLEWHRKLLRNPEPQDAELVTWVCRDNPEYLDLTANVVREPWES